MTANCWRRVLVIIAALWCAGAAWAGEDSDPAAADLPIDEWQVLLMQGQRVGHIHIASYLDGDDVVTKTSTSLTLTRLGSEARVQVAETYRERLDGTPLSFSTIQRTGMIAVQHEGAIKDGKLHLVTIQGERRRESEHDWDAEALFPHALHLKQQSLTYEPGEELTVKVYSPDISPTKPTTMRLKVIGKETVDVLGIAVEATKIEARVAGLTGMTETSWVDAKGNPLVTSIPLFDTRAVRCTKEYALGEVKPLEIFSAMLVKPDKPIEAPERLTRLVVRLSTADGSPLAVQFDSAGYQRVLERDEASVTLEISSALTKTEEKDLTRYLASTTYLDASDARIVNAAKQAVRLEKDPWTKARLLRAAVFQLIEEKSFGVAMATASEVIASKEGDCTEHAVLLAAMARAAGVPSRVAIGLIHFQGVFGYHMWTQVYVNGAWRDVDAVLPGRDFDAAHIRLATSAMGDADTLLDIAVFAAVIGKLKIEVVAADHPERAGGR
ncbi:MAG: transglutaminase domain-containing protein [Verrucomicrobia bacterium]|nr:transglutaminase domain-containing protein [Verrucomicrobiota bacterium]